ncbi:MAG: hypothetical protein KBD25_00105 [Rickettsiaceae bacterium]|nr:hypothetical protein [Rickettsiaceae bacterium]
MKITNTHKILAAGLLLAPMAMYASGGGVEILDGAYTMLKTSVGGPLKGLIFGAEVVGAGWHYSQNKNPAVFVGLPILMGFTALAIGVI